MPTKNRAGSSSGNARSSESHSGNKQYSEDRNENQRSHAPDPIGIALRKHGIDEDAIAETFAYTLDALKGIVPVKDSDKKLLIEFVKECTKLLKGDADATLTAPVQVRLIHNVARPDRGVPREGAGDAGLVPSKASACTGNTNAPDQRQIELFDEDGEEERSDSTVDDALLN